VTYASSGSVDTGAATVTALAIVMALLQIVLLVGPAFAVGLRRRRRDLGLLAVSGARPGQLRRVVLAEGVVLGVVGSAVGLAVALARASAPPTLPERGLGVVAGLLAVARRASAALRRRRDGPLAPRKRAHLGHQLAHHRLLSVDFNWVRLV